MLTIADVDRVCAMMGQLHRAMFPGLHARRTLYYSDFVRLLLLGQAPGMTAAQRGRWLAARAVLEAFVDGYWMTVKSKPKSRAQFAILEPYSDEVWEIRDVKPKPSLRILGSFASKDFFIALAPYERSQLGKKTSPEWAMALQIYKEQWKWLFDGHQPMSGSFPDDYLSNARHLD